MGVIVRGQDLVAVARSPGTVDPAALPAGSIILAGLGRSLVIPSVDFETYSEAGYIMEPQQVDERGRWTPPYKVRGIGSQGKGGLPVVGTPVYAEHPSTEILSLSYDLKDGRGKRRWLPGFPPPPDLLEYVASGGPIEAWNIPFEFWIWNMIGHRRLGWPPLRLTQCYCAMAKARRYSLPGALNGAAKVLGTPLKDPAGETLIRKVCRPHTPTQGRPAHRWTPATAWADFLALYDYNDGDVVAEDHASAHVPDLPDDERQVWLMDQTINLRGVGVDVETLTAALAVLGQAERYYTDELRRLTAGEVTSVSQVEKIVDWSRQRGVRMPDCTADTVREYLGKPDLPADVHAVLSIRDSLGGANVKKLRSLRAQLSRDGRLRGQYMYCGADRTGRWASIGVQLQNITSGGPDTSFCEGCERYFGTSVSLRQCPRCGCPAVRGGDWDMDAIEDAIADIRTQDVHHLLRIWGVAVDVLTGCLRALFVPAPGKKFICVDFSAIEAVVAACLARCQWRIDVFSSHGKIYEASAAKATGIPFEEILDHKKRTGKDHPARKGVGKIRELAGGYGGWINAWKNFGAEKWYEDDNAIKQDVLKWRAESPEIVDMWGGQFRWCGPGRWDFRPELHGLEGAAIMAIQNPGQCFHHYDVTYGVYDDVLHCRLPSGRFLYYHRPRLLPAEDKLNRGPAVKVTFEAWNSNSQKGPPGWIVEETYGGKLFENVVQAVARDIQAGALLRCEQNGYPIVMHTHDEGCAEVPDSPEYTIERMTELMVERPDWAAWWPIRGAGWEGYRYRKD